MEAGGKLAGLEEGQNNFEERQWKDVEDKGKEKGNRDGTKEKEKEEEEYRDGTRLSLAAGPKSPCRERIFNHTCKGCENPGFKPIIFFTWSRFSFSQALPERAGFRPSKVDEKSQRASYPACTTTATAGGAS